ncbi:hypothetical protein PR048_010050 [Dryococelus australis]|uniref:Uncharacterized protein n=1 Tax=Dryococelus australis TaxID=614101 RepID=A0ABQ9I2E0_9NEOP|nr:hypothetical protein PR048_010050 [Dryococelus australis]
MWKLYVSEEQISAVSQELRKCGQQMPSFQKIGGILSLSGGGDEAELHTAVLSINHAVDKQVILWCCALVTAHLSNYILFFSCLRDTLVSGQPREDARWCSSRGNSSILRTSTPVRESPFHKMLTSAALAL